VTRRILTGNGYRVITAGKRDLLPRVSRLADDVPEVTELDPNPVIARPGDLSVQASSRSCTRTSLDRPAAPTHVRPSVAQP
jgi:hypothetical protein